MSKELVAQILAQRESRLELQPGKSVVVRRPSEYEMVAPKSGTSLDFILRYVVGWDGYTEADLLGQAVGSDQPVGWDPAVFAVYLTDRMADIRAIDTHLGGLITAYAKQRESVAKN